MNYNKKALAEKQQALTKGLSELLDILQDIELDDDAQTSDVLVLDDETEVQLSVDTSGDTIKQFVTLRKGNTKYTVCEEKDTAGSK